MWFWFRLGSMIFWPDDLTFYYGSIGALLVLMGVMVLAAAPGRVGEFSNGGGLAKGRLHLIFEALWVLGLVLLLFAARWPRLFYPKAYLIDEDQFLVAAWSLARDPVFFRSVETASSGPFNIYPLLLANLWSAQPDLFDARVVGLILTAGIVLALYAGLLQTGSVRVARAATLSLTTFFALTTYWDFLHYSSEVPPLFFLSVGLWGAVFAGLSESTSRVARNCLIGIAACALALAPLAKLQSVYLAMGTGLLLAGATLLFPKALQFRERIRSAVVAVVAPLLLISLISGIFAATGVFEYFWKSYILNAVAYVDTGFAKDSVPALVWNLGKTVPYFAAFAVGWLVLFFLFGILISFFWKQLRSIPLGLWFFLAGGILLFCLAVYTVAAPRRPWTHYLQFLPLYLVFLGGVMGVIFERLIQSSSGPGRVLGIFGILPSLLVLLAGVGPAVVCWVGWGEPALGAARGWHAAMRQPQTPAGKLLRELAGERTDVRLTVWGYNPNYHTDTRMLQATRLAISPPQFANNPLREFFRRTYLEDLIKNRPEFFADATGRNQFPSMNDPDKFRHELVPELAGFIAENYELAGEVEGVRIYRLRE